MILFLTRDSMLLPPHALSSGTLVMVVKVSCPPSSRKHPSCNNNSVPDLGTACSHHAFMVNTVVAAVFTGQMPFLSPNQQCQ